MEDTKEKLIELLGDLSCRHIIKENCGFCKYGGEDMCQNHAIADHLIANDIVSVMHGRWEEAGFDGHGDYKECCSNCKSWSVGVDKLYCPVCGAKMDG